jgi:predicted DNA-binding WGR domain protein
MRNLLESKKLEYHCNGENSHKFYEARLYSDASWECTYGRIGTKGVINAKVFGSQDLAQTNYNETIISKIKKGYVEVK